MMSKLKKTVISLLAFALLTQPEFALADSSTMKTIDGNSPIETAIKVAQELNSQTNTYIITTTYNYPDALAGTVLAGKYSAPILFVDNGNNQAVFDYLKSKNANSSTKFFILGGTGAVSQTVENQLKAISSNVTRLGGIDRYATVDLINSYLNPKYNTPVIIATGLNYPDALAMGAISGQFQYPIYLINESGIPDSVANQLKKINPGFVYIAGGTGVVPKELESQIRQLAPASTITRLGGIDRYETSAKIADWFKDKLPQRVYATGEDFHSALVSATLASQKKASILLADNISPDQQTTMNQQMGYMVGNINRATPAQIIAKIEQEKLNAPYIKEQYWMTYKPTIIFNPLPESILSSPVNTLTDDDIKMIQSYPQYDTMRQGETHWTLDESGNRVQVPPTEYYLTFEAMYSEEPSNCEGFAKKFSPIRLNDYRNAKVEWLTSPKLIYRAANNQTTIRGILSLTYYNSDNPYGLLPFKKYQTIVEYNISYGFTLGIDKFGDNHFYVNGKDYMTNFKLVEDAVSY